MQIIDLNLPKYRDLALEVAYRRALPNVRDASNTLANALSIVVDSSTQGHLYIPHYWAIYVNDGRGPVAPVVAKFLVWFRNPLDDPRIKDGYPERASDIRRLTREEFRYWAAKNAEAGFGHEPMIVARSVKTPVAARHFFDNFGGMAFLWLEINRAVNPVVREDIRASLGDLLDMRWSTVLKI